MSFIDITLSETAYILGLTVYSLVLVAFSFIYMYWLKQKLSAKSATGHFFFCIFMSVALAVIARLVVIPGEVDWVVLLPNGTEVVVSHSDWFSSVFPAVRLAVYAATAFTCLILLAGLAEEVSRMFAARRL